MKKRHMLFAGALIFGTGFMAGQANLDRKLVYETPSQKIETDHWLHKNQPMPLASSALENKNTKAAPEKTAPVARFESKPISIFVPLDEFFEDKDLGDLIQAEVYAGPVEKYVSSPDGSIVSVHKAEDGGELLRLYKDNGLFIGETWRQSSGNEINRDFYNDGRIKGFALRKADGSATLISFLESGRFKSRVDEYADGSKLITEYNDSGEVVSRTKLGRDGSSQRLSF